MTLHKGNSAPQERDWSFSLVREEWPYRFFDALEWLGPHSNHPAERNEIVVYAPGHLGDFLQMTPMLKALRMWAVGKQVTWLVGAWTLDLARRYKDWADDIREFSPQKTTLVRGNAKWKRCVCQQWRELLSIRREGVDVLISTMPEDPTTRFVANTLRPNLWVGVGDRRPPRVRTDIRVETLPFEKDCPEAEAQLKLLDLVWQVKGPPKENGIGERRALVFPVTGTEREWCRHFLDEEGLSGHPFAILSPGSGWKGKNWPAERFALIANWLQTQGMEVAWTGSASELDLCRGPGRNWMGKLTLGQLAAVMERAAIWIGNDSGPLHLAVAMGCKTVSFWGPTSECKWGGQGDGHAKVRGMDRCPGCVYWDWRRPCPKEGHPCMNAISVEMTKRSIEQVLARQRH